MPAETPYPVSAAVWALIQAADKAGIAAAAVNGVAIAPSSITSSGAIVGDTGTFSEVTVAGFASIANITLLNVIDFPANIRQVFSPGGANSGINVGAVAADPASLQDGDIWYNYTDGAFRIRKAGATVDLGAAGGAGLEYISSPLSSLADSRGALGARCYDATAGVVYEKVQATPSHVWVGHNVSTTL